MTEIRTFTDIRAAIGDLRNQEPILDTVIQDLIDIEGYDGAVIEVCRRLAMFYASSHPDKSDGYRQRVAELLGTATVIPGGKTRAGGNRQAAAATPSGTTGVDSTARAEARAAQTDIDEHEANHPAGDDAFDWATEGNADAIPVDKLGNAPAGYTDAEADNRVKLHTGQTTDTGDFADNRISPAIARVTEVDTKVEDHDDSAASHGAVESGLASHISAHPGAVQAGPPPADSVGRDTLTSALRDDVDAHADQADLDSHTSSPHDSDTTARNLITDHTAETHNHDQTARDEAQTAQTLIEGHQIASAPHTEAIDNRIANHTMDADAHHTPGGGEGGTPFSAETITNFPSGPAHSDVQVVASNEGVAQKNTYGEIIDLGASSAHFGARLLPTPTADDIGKVPTPTDMLDPQGNRIYTLVSVGGSMVIDGPVDAVAQLDGNLQWNPANRRVEICRNNGHTVEATEGTWDYIADRNDLYIEESVGFISGQAVGDYAYDAGAGHFYFWAVVAVDSMGNQVLGWYQVNPSTALAASRRTTGVLVYWLGDQPNDAAALAALGARHGTYDVTAQDAFYLRNDTIRRIETFTAAGTYIDNWGWLPMQRPPVPRPAADGQSLVAHDGEWVSQSTPIPYEIVTEVPTAMAGAIKLAYLIHDYAIGGLRRDVNIRFSRVGDFTGYSDPRLGTPVGTLGEPGPIVSILVIADNDGLITRYDVVRFIDQESAEKHDEIALGPDGDVSLYTLGIAYQHGHVWERRFIGAEPQNLRLDTEYKINLGRAVDATFHYTDGTGIVYRTGFYELIEIVPGEFIYDAISSLRRVHTSGIGEPTTPPVRTGETYTDDLGRTYTGLVEIVDHDDSADGTPVILVNALYERKPLGLQEILDLGTGAWWWQNALGVGNFNQFESDTLASLVRDKNWNAIWTLVAANVTPSSVEHIEAVAIRDHSVFLGGYVSHAEALDHAAISVSQSEFDGGIRIFYGQAVGNEDTIPNANTRGVYELTQYTAAVITRTRQGLWIGPLATEKRVQELITIHNDDPDAHPGLAGGGGGETRTILYDDTVTLNRNTTYLPGSIAVPTTGDLEIAAFYIGDQRAGMVRIPPAWLTVRSASTTDASDGDATVLDIEVANRRLYLQNLNGLIAVAAHNNTQGPWMIRVIHIT